MERGPAWPPSRGGRKTAEPDVLSYSTHLAEQHKAGVGRLFRGCVGFDLVAGSGQKNKKSGRTPFVELAGDQSRQCEVGTIWSKLSLPVVHLEKMNAA